MYIYARMCVRACARVVLHCLFRNLRSRPILQRLNYLGTCKDTLQQFNYVATYNKSIVQK